MDPSFHFDNDNEFAFRLGIAEHFVRLEIIDEEATD